MGYRRRFYRRRYRDSGNTEADQFAAFIVLLGVVGFLLVKAGHLFTLLKWACGIAAVVALYWILRKKLQQNNAQTGVVSVAIRDLDEERKQNTEHHQWKRFDTELTWGEQSVSKLLQEELDYKEYFVFNNVITPSTHNGSSQIDHIVVSRFGIFVIENKEYSGWIFGSKNNEMWTQSLAGGNAKTQFKNPLRQNWSHVQSLKAILPAIPESAFQNLVVFSGTAEIKTPRIENVVIDYELIDCIKKYDQVVVPNERLYPTIGLITHLCQTVPISSKQHLDNLAAHEPALM